MGADERGPAGNGASDDACGRDSHDTPYDPPPPGLIDPGGGQYALCGGLADLLAAAGWIERHGDKR